VKQWARLPICVGFGHSKTLAKLANHCVKKQSVWNGVCDLTALSEAELDAILEELPVSSMGCWKALRGTPEQSRDHVCTTIEEGRSLSGLGITSGYSWSVPLMELNGECWLELDEMLQESKQVMSSRSFGARVTELEDLEQAISFHAANAATLRIFLPMVPVFNPSASSLATNETRGII